MGFGYSVPELLSRKEDLIDEIREYHDQILELKKYREMLELGQPITEYMLSEHWKFEYDLLDHVRDYGANYGSFVETIDELIKEREIDINYGRYDIDEIDRIIAGTNDPAAN